MTVEPKSNRCPSQRFHIKSLFLATTLRWYMRYGNTYVGGGSPDATHGISTSSLTRKAIASWGSDTIVGGTETIGKQRQTTTTTG